MINFVLVAVNGIVPLKLPKGVIPQAIAKLSDEVTVMIVEEDSEGEAFLQTLNRVRNKYRELFNTDKITLVAI